MGQRVAGEVLSGLNWESQDGQRVVLYESFLIASMCPRTGLQDFSWPPDLSTIDSITKVPFGL